MPSRRGRKMSKHISDIRFSEQGYTPSIADDEPMIVKGEQVFVDAANLHISKSQEFYTFDEPFIFEPEPMIVLSLHDAAEQALWDLRQWVKDHPRGCECFTCGDSIPDLERVLNPPAEFHGICC